MVAELIANQLLCSPIVDVVARLDQSDALFVIHDVERFTNQPSVRTRVLAINLEPAQIDSLVFQIASRQFGDFANPLAGGVIDIPGAFALTRGSICIRGIYSLALGHLQLVLEVPLHDLQLRHTGHIAVGVVPVTLSGAGAHSRAGEAVAVLQERAPGAILNQTGFGVGVTARPARIRGIGANMLHLLKVTNGIVYVALEVCAHDIAVGGCETTGVTTEKLNTTGVVVRMWARRIGHAANLPEMLAASGLYQPIDGVVGVVIAWFDTLVVEVDRLLRIVT